MSIYSIKEQEITDTPLMLFDVMLPNGNIARWATHKVVIGEDSYAPRILSHNTFELKSGGEDGIDGVSRLSIILANADSYLSQIERTVGFKGSKITVRFLFYDLGNNVPTTDSIVLFKGIANAADISTESRVRLSFVSRLNLQRVLLPNVRIQRRCPWMFPATADQRAIAIHGGDNGKYSPYFRCGYSADQPDGVGNLNGEEPYTSCDFTRAQCEQRGMFDRDNSNRVTARFGGIEFVPAGTLVRSAGESGRHVSQAIENTARYNDFVPMVYGTAWIQPLIVFARNDGNLTRMEVIVSLGEIQDVAKVVVNGIEIPVGQAGRDMTATGWFNIVSHGNRTGHFNVDFSDSSGVPMGDPYGSMAYLSVVVPNRISDGQSLPRIEALVQGVKISIFDIEGNYTGEAFSNNPAMVMLDVLRRIGWALDELNLASFGRAAKYCDDPIKARDLNGNEISIPRFQSNVALRKRQSAAEVIRGIRNASSLFLTFGLGGRLELKIEGTVAQQQPERDSSSNAPGRIADGWAAYEFGDGSNGLPGGILRKENGESSVQISTRSTAESPNRVSLEFQDAFNEYQQDSLSLIDPDDILTAGQEVAATINALGIANLDQATRIARLHLNKSVLGNTFVEFDTSMKGIGVRPGDLITFTYLKEGFERQLFRVVKISPSTNYRTATVYAQIHDDGWYSDDGGVGGRRRRRGGAEIGIPRPLSGKVLDEEGNAQLEVIETALDESDGGAKVLLTVEFTPPARASASRAAIPMLSLSALVDTSGGSLAGGQSLYYAISGLDSDGAESELSFAVRASLPASSSTNSVRLQGLSFDADTVGFAVYRGNTPQQLEKIAHNAAIGTEFLDVGLESLLSPPPDSNYDHANFYWRFELQPAASATIATANTIGNHVLTMVANEHRGTTVRILSGTGKGQERTVLANDLTSLAISRPWDIIPDTSSTFVVAESSWRFGSLSHSDRAEFEVPNRGGYTVQISGRSANARDAECPPDLSPLTRWRIGGAAGEALDVGPPEAPIFGLVPVGDGALELVSVAFNDLANTRSIAGATLTLHYWNELVSPTPYMLAALLSDESSIVELSPPGRTDAVGALIQIDDELMIVEEVLEDRRYRVARGALDTLAMARVAGSAVYHLDRRAIVAPFVRDFFGSPASGSYACPIFLPNTRVAAAELFVTNSRGNGPIRYQSFTSNVDFGLRTLAGAQMSLQVNGYLAVHSNAAPPALVNGSRSVRDVFATLREAPQGAPIFLRVLVNETPYCDLVVPAGSKFSNTVSGFGLPALADMSIITIDILSVPPSGSGSPGSELTVTVRS